jgi:hypothetical protein
MTAPLDPNILAYEPMIHIALRIQPTLLAAIDRQSRQSLTNRSAWLRNIAFHEIQKKSNNR